MRISKIPVSRIKPAVYNPRKDLKPDDTEYRRLVRSLDEFGCVEPLVWNQRTGNLVGGHQRFKVLVAQGKPADRRQRRRSSPGPGEGTQHRPEQGRR